MLERTESKMRILSPVLQVFLSIIATLILTTLTDVKNQSKEVVKEFQEYQKVMDKRVTRLEFTIYGDGTDGNKGLYGKY